MVSIRFTGNGGILHYDGQDENTKEKADAGGDDNTGTKQQSHGRQRPYNSRHHNTTDKRKNNTYDKPMGNVTMTGPGTKQESYGRQGPYNRGDHNTTDKRKKQHTREADG